MWLVWGCGPAKSNGIRFNSGATAQDILAQTVLAMIHGGCGVGVYGYDPPRWRRDRLENPPGVLLQTGSRPGDERWSGVAAGFRFIERFEEHLLGRHYEPIKKGPYWWGRRGDLVLAVNVSEFEQPNPGGRGKVEPGGVRYWEV